VHFWHLKYMDQWRDDVDGKHQRISVCVHNFQSFCHLLLKKSGGGAKLESNEQTSDVTHWRHSQISERFNISNTIKKVYQRKSNSGVAVVITTKLQRGTQSWSLFGLEKQRQKRKMEKNTHRLKDRGSAIQQKWNGITMARSWDKLEQRC